MTIVGLGGRWQPSYFFYERDLTHSELLRLSKYLVGCKRARLHFIWGGPPFNAAEMFMLTSSAVSASFPLPPLPLPLQGYVCGGRVALRAPILISPPQRRNPCSLFENKYILYIIYYILPLHKMRGKRSKNLPSLSTGFRRGIRGICLGES